MPDSLVLVPILAPLATAFLIPFFMVFWKRSAPFLCLLAIIGSLISLLFAAKPVFTQGQVLVYWMGGWTPVGSVAIGIDLAVDAWGLFIALTIALVGLLVIIYSIVYMKEETGKSPYYSLVMLLLASMIGFTLTGDLFNQFVWLEILSFSAFALTAFHYEERVAVEGAFKYLITNSVASLFIVVALALLYATTGALNLAAAAGQFGNTSGEMIALGLLFAGYATKTALVPWHFWLPDAYQGAPAPITALFSGALSKVGIYAIGRLLFTLTPPLFNTLVRTIFLGIAALTMLVGGFQMLRQESLKRILAYSSVSQMGYILMGLSVGTPIGIAAACLHILNHSLSKTTLFIGTGTIRMRSGITNIFQGGGLIRKMPMTFGLMAFSGLSLSGIPIMVGFYSKSMLETSAILAGDFWLTVVAVLSSIFTFAGIGRLLWSVFFLNGNLSSQKAEDGAAPLTIIAMSIPVVLLLLTGIFAATTLNWFSWPSATALLQPGHYVDNVLPVLQKPPGIVIPISFPPSLLSLKSWIVPWITLIAGTILIVLSLPKQNIWFWGRTPIRQVAIIIRRWHSGILTDYTLWIAFSTSILVVLFYLIYRLLL